MMRLTKLPDEVQAYIASGKLSAGHARALIGVPDPAAAAKRIVEEGLNVRQAEALAHVEGVPERKPQKARGGKVKDADTIALEKRVSDALGWPSASITAIPAAPCTSAIAISNSSTRFCAGWIRGGLCRHPEVRAVFGEPRRMDATKVFSAHPFDTRARRSPG